MSQTVDGAEPPYLIAAYLRALFDYLRQQGLELGPVLAAAGLNEAALADPDRRIEASAEERAFLAAEQLSGDANIGLHVGCSLRPTHFGLLGHLMLTSRQLHELFELHGRYAQLVGNDISAHYTLRGEEMCLEVQVHPARGLYHRHCTESNLAGWISTARWLAGQALSPLRIEFPHAAPADTREQEALFACPLRFGSEHLRVHFPARYAALPLLHGDSGLKQTLELEARRRLLALRVEQSHGDLRLAGIRQHIADRLPHGAPELSSVAAALDLSARSLQRQLDGLGTSYTGLVEVVRQDLARRYVDDASLSLVDVALMLGFAEQSSFQRAFRRWFNMTPGEYRRVQARQSV